MDVLENFPFRGQSHNWDLILDGQCWRMTKGEDFSCESRSMMQSIYKEAKRREIKVRTSRDGDTIVVQAYREKE